MTPGIGWARITVPTLEVDSLSLGQSLKEGGESCSSSETRGTAGRECSCVLISLLPGY